MGFTSQSPIVQLSLSPYVIFWLVEPLIIFVNGYNKKFFPCRGNIINCWLCRSLKSQDSSGFASRVDLIPQPLLPQREGERLYIDSDNNFWLLCHAISKPHLQPPKLWKSVISTVRAESIGLIVPIKGGTVSWNAIFSANLPVSGNAIVRVMKNRDTWALYIDCEPTWAIQIKIQDGNGSGHGWRRTDVEVGCNSFVLSPPPSVQPGGIRWSLF